MNVYFVALIDLMEVELVNYTITVGRDEAEAASSFDLTPEQKKLIKKGEMILVYNDLASFEPIEITRTKPVD